jgi:hypothetical protein
MNERNRPIHEQQSGGSIGGLFDDDEAPSPDLVLVASAFHNERLPVINMTVGEIRARFADRFDLDPRSAAYIDSHAVGDDTVIRAGQALMFMHRAGEKGAAA